MTEFIDKSQSSFTLASQKKAFPRTRKSLGYPSSFSSSYPVYDANSTMVCVDYQSFRFPVDLEDLLYPCGLRFKYFDDRFKF